MPRGSIYIYICLNYNADNSGTDTLSLILLVGHSSCSDQAWPNIKATLWQLAYRPFIQGGERAPILYKFKV